MLFHDKEIGIPTLSQIQEYVEESGVFATPEDIYEFWSNRDWTTKKGTIIKSLEVAVNAYNGIAVQREKKKSKQKTKSEKKQIRIAQLKESRVKKSNRRKKSYMVYKDQLNDERWKYFRWFVLKVRGEKCEVCGTNKNLQVHHLKYNGDARAWEYTCNDVMVVCRDCHKKIHNIK